MDDEVTRLMSEQGESRDDILLLCFFIINPDFDEVERECYEKDAYTAASQ